MWGACWGQRFRAVLLLGVGGLVALVGRRHVASVLAGLGRGRQATRFLAQQLEVFRRQLDSRSFHRGDTSRDHLLLRLRGVTSSRLRLLNDVHLATAVSIVFDPLWDHGRALLAFGFGLLALSREHVRVFAPDASNLLRRRHFRTSIQLEHSSLHFRFTWHLIPLLNCFSGNQDT